MRREPSHVSRTGCFEPRSTPAFPQDDDSDSEDAAVDEDEDDSDGADDDEEDSDDDSSAETAEEGDSDGDDAGEAGSADGEALSADAVFVDAPMDSASDGETSFGGPPCRAARLRIAGPTLVANSDTITYSCHVS